MGRGPDFTNPYKNKELHELGRNIGVDPDDFQEEDTGSQGRFDHDAWVEAIEKGYSDDYSTRRALEAANLAGEDVPENIQSIDDAWAAHEWMKGQHQGGGKYSSDSDRANVAWDWVKKDRENFTSDLEDSFADYIEKNQDETADETNQQTADISQSPELQAAYSRVNEAEQGMSNISNEIFGYSPSKAAQGATDKVTESKPNSDGDDQRYYAAQDFHDAFKVDLMQGLRENPYGGIGSVYSG